MYDERVLADSFKTIMRRYGQGATPEAFVSVLCPLLIPVHSLDKTVERLRGEKHWRASFTLKITDENRGILRRGRTGKFVPADFQIGSVWKEIAKGRVVRIDQEAGLAFGEVYTGRRKTDLESALEEMDGTELLEIDQYGAAAKVLSGLAEFELVRQAGRAGYVVTRMPEDMAQHLGAYANFDFIFEKDGVEKKVEAKSLWGTNTDCARLIHSKSRRAPNGPPATWTPEQKRNYYPTSSCKFETQEIFAVSLFLRTGDIRDFAFARSVPETQHPHGLPVSSTHPDHVSQNPRVEIGGGTWFSTIDEVWNLP